MPKYKQQQRIIITASFDQLKNYMPDKDAWKLKNDYNKILIAAFDDFDKFSTFYFVKCDEVKHWLPEHFIAKYPQKPILERIINFFMEN